MNEWYIFKKGNQKDTERIRKLPKAPKWRQFHSNGGVLPKSDEPWSKRRGRTFEAGEDEIRMVNTALYLRRPLLITGKPGTGKSSLAYAVAYELGLGDVLCWPITTSSKLKEGLYDYDPIGRLQDLQISRYKGEDNRKDPPDIGQYISLGPLGTAFLPAKRPRVLLIDEIDKSDIDLPNELLNIFEEGAFEIKELSRLSQRQEKVEVFTFDSQSKVEITKGKVVCEEFPLVFLTSNAEREFPAPFLRRCLRLDIKEPNSDKLKKIVEAHFGDDLTNHQNTWKELIETFIHLRKKGDLSTDQLLNAIYLTTNGISISPQKNQKDDLRNAIFSYLSNMGT